MTYIHVITLNLKQTKQFWKKLNIIFLSFHLFVLRLFKKICNYNFKIYIKSHNF